MSESKSNIYKSLSLAQGEFKAIPFDKVNTHFKNKYASLSATQEMYRPVLSKHGLALIQFIYTEENSYILETVLTHLSGEQLSSRLRLMLDKSNMQGLGSAITYAKRYTAQAILGISGDEDDDGNAAVSKTEDKVETKKEYPKVEPQDFVLNLGSIKDTKLGEIPNDKLVEIGVWLSDAIKKDPKNPKTKFYQYAYGQIKKVIEMNSKSLMEYGDESDYPQDPQSFPQNESENPFDDFQKKKN